MTFPSIRCHFSSFSKNSSSDAYRKRGMIPFTHCSDHYPLTERKTSHLALGTDKALKSLYPNPDKIPVFSNRKCPRELLAGWKVKYQYITLSGGKKETVNT